MRSFGYVKFNSWKSNYTAKKPLIIWLFQRNNFRPLDAVLKLSHLQGLLTKLTISVSLAMINIKQKTSRMTLCCMSLYLQAGTCPTWPRTVVEATPTLLVTIITSITSSKRSPPSPYLVRRKFATAELFLQRKSPWMEHRIKQGLWVFSRCVHYVISWYLHEGHVVM